jgi:hypothetical protein
MLVIRYITSSITYSTTKLPTLLNRLKSLSITNLYYVSLILLLLNKEPIYVMLISNLEDASVSFLHVRVLYLVPLQFL